MSVSTPILTTSSEICAFAAPPEAARARPAATTAANDFMVSSPWAFVEGFRFSPVFYPAWEASAKPKAGRNIARKIDLPALNLAAAAGTAGALAPRQCRHGNIDRAFGLRDHAERFGIEGDIGRPQAGDFRRHPHAVLVLLKVRYSCGDFLLCIGCERLEVDGGLFGKDPLQMRHGRARGGSEQPERGFRFHGEFDIGQAQGLLRLIEHRPAPDMHGCLAA